MNLEEKDILYYDDLIYQIKKLAGFEISIDEETNERIILREKPVAEKDSEGIFTYLFKLSMFEEELFTVIRNISIKAGTSFESLDEISKYPELVNEAITEIKNKKENLKNNNLVLKK